MLFIQTLRSDINELIAHNIVMAFDLCPHSLPQPLCSHSIPLYKQILVYSSIHSSG